MLLLVIIYDFVYTTVKQVIKNVMIGLISVTIIMIINSNNAAEKRKIKADLLKNKSKKTFTPQEQALQPKNINIKKQADVKGSPNTADILKNIVNQTNVDSLPTQLQIVQPKGETKLVVDALITVPSAQSCPANELPEKTLKPKAIVLPATSKNLQNISLLIEDKKVSTEYQKTWKRGSRLKELQERNKKRAEEEAKKLS